MAPLRILVLGLFSPEMGCGSFGLSGKLLVTTSFFFILNRNVVFLLIAGQLFERGSDAGDADAVQGDPRATRY